jgi:hypothetical protein
MIQTFKIIGIRLVTRGLIVAGVVIGFLASLLFAFPVTEYWLYFGLYQELLFNFTDLSGSSFYYLLLPVYNAYTDKLTILSENQNKAGILQENKLDPKFITGFSDAESSFIICINKRNDFKLG